MRNFALARAGILVAVFLALSFPCRLASQAAAQKAPTAPAAPIAPPAPAKKKAASPAVTACKVESITLLKQADGATVSKLLMKMLPGFAVSVPDPKQPTTLLVVDQTAAPKDCAKKGWVTALPKGDLDTDWKALDQDDFQGATFDPKYLIHVPNLTTDDAFENLAHPTDSLLLKKIGGEYLLPVPEHGGRTADLSSSALTQQALQIKHDVESLDEEYAFMGGANVLLNFLQSVNSAPNAQSRDMILARWLARHTITLSLLEPREVILAFQDKFAEEHCEFFPLVGQNAIAMVPQDAMAKGVSQDALRAWFSAEALERNVLLANAARAKQQQSDASASTPPKTPADPTSAAGGGGSTPAVAPKAAAAAVAPTAPAAPAPATTTTTTITTTSPAPAAKQAPPVAGAPAAPVSPAPATTTTTNTATTNGGASGGGQGAPQTQSKSCTADPSNTPTSVPSVQARIVRLYHLREAPAIAAAINSIDANDSKTNPLVAALDNDQLLILPPAACQPDRMEDIRRTIALLDLPRPQIALQVWSYQISSEDKKKAEDQRVKDIRDQFDIFRNKVRDANEILGEALARGMGAVEGQARLPLYFDKTFLEYLTSPYHKCAGLDRYCLGYSTALLVPAASKQEPSASPSLSRFLLLLAAADDSRIVDAATALKTGMLNGAPADLKFERFFKQLDFLTKLPNLHMSRAAILDFFFQYKLAVAYPRDFGPYGLQQAAHALDNILGPLMDAFDQDVDDYVDAALTPPAPDKKTASVLFGQVGVTTISGTQAEVTGKVANYFDVTQPPTLADVLNNGSGTAGSGLATTLANVLTPKEITIAQFIANANTQPKVYAQVAKDASLTITPISLDDASAAELDVQFDVKDDGDPTTVNQTSSKTDLLDRVAEHEVKDNVRVESLKLFQISTFAMQLTHKSPPKCWAYSPFCVAWKAVFGSIPVLDDIFEITPAPQTIDNRSSAVVRAVVVPTAMDLGMSVRYENDRIIDPVTHAAYEARSVGQLSGNIFEFHKKFMQCLVQEVTNCFDKTKLSAMHEDFTRNN